MSDRVKDLSSGLAGSGTSNDPTHLAQPKSHITKGRKLPLFPAPLAEGNNPIRFEDKKAAVSRQPLFLFCNSKQITMLCDHEVKYMLPRLKEKYGFYFNGKWLCYDEEENKIYYVKEPFLTACETDLVYED